MFLRVSEEELREFLGRYRFVDWRQFFHAKNMSLDMGVSVVFEIEESRSFPREGEFELVEQWYVVPATKYTSGRPYLLMDIRLEGLECGVYISFPPECVAALLESNRLIITPKKKPEWLQSPGIHVLDTEMLFSMVGDSSVDLDLDDSENLQIMGQVVVTADKVIELRKRMREIEQDEGGQQYGA